MALLLDGSGSITGLSAGGLPDSSITADDIATGAVTQAKIADGAITSAKLDTTTSQLFGMRNRIINGDMRIDQRNAGASSTVVDGTYYLDRYKFYSSQASKYTVQQNAGSVTPPAGFTNYMGLTVTSAVTSLGATDYFEFLHIIEGYNVADLAWGTASAKTITLSFWIRSSVTGTFGGVIKNSDGARGYVFTYTISSANTWEYKTITITGDTSGTWLTNNGKGITLGFSIGMGSTYSTTPNVWQTTGADSATGATNLLATNGATFYITGVQLEVGSTATPFERRMFGQELVLCQRYYNKSYNIETVPGTNTDVGIVIGANATNAAGSNAWPDPIRFPVSMRSAPTVSTWDKAGNSAKYSSYVQPTFTDNFGSITIITTGQNGCYFTQGATNGYNACVHYTASAEL